MQIDDQREEIRALIRGLMEKTGLDASGLARAAGIVPSTLTRFLNKPVKHLLTTRTLTNLSKVSEVPVPFGGPVTSLLEQELLANCRATDDRGREILLRLSRLLILAPTLITPEPVDY